MSDAELARFGGTSLRTLQNWKKPPYSEGGGKHNLYFGLKTLYFLKHKYDYVMSNAEIARMSLNKIEDLISILNKDVSDEIKASTNRELRQNIDTLREILGEL